MLHEIVHSELPAYAASLIDQVREGTNIPVVILEGEYPGTNSELWIAKPGEGSHRIVLDPDYGGHRLHFLVSGALKILRTCSVPPEERYLPSAQRGSLLPRKYHMELERRVRTHAEEGFEPEDDDIKTFSIMIREQLTLQLTSLPLDIWVERKVAETLPEHLDIQRACLEQQVRGMETNFDPDVISVFPEDLFAATIAMNLVLVVEAAEIASVDPGRNFLETPLRPLGEKLRTRLIAEKETGPKGDRRATDAWARELGMEGWYKWLKSGEIG